MQKQNLCQGDFMPKNRQHYRKIKYPDKVTKQNALYLSGYFYFLSFINIFSSAFFLYPESHPITVACPYKHLVKSVKFIGYSISCYCNTSSDLARKVHSLAQCTSPYSSVKSRVVVFKVVPQFVFLFQILLIF